MGGVGGGGVGGERTRSEKWRVEMRKWWKKEIRESEEGKKDEKKIKVWGKQTRGN